MEEKIRDLYNCNKLIGDDSLVIWHNQVIEKKVDELSISDVARCIRQNLFLESAYEMLLVYLLHNPYAGDVYEGELMDKAGEIDHDYLIKHKETILEIIENAKSFIAKYDWQCDEDKTEFIEAVDKLSEII